MPTGIYERTELHRKRLSECKKGRKPKNHATALAKAHAMPKPSGEENPNWKGDCVGYHGLHSWIRKILGAPKECELCKTTNARRYEWANKSGEYKRDLSDWRRLCVACHRRTDYARGNYTIWNKGKKVQSNSGRTHIKLGQRISTATEFKKGIVPHNKYLVAQACAHCGSSFQPREAKRRFCSRPCYWNSLKKET